MLIPLILLCRIYWMTFNPCDMHTITFSINNWVQAITALHPCQQPCVQFENTYTIEVIRGKLVNKQKDCTLELFDMCQLFQLSPTGKIKAGQSWAQLVAVSQALQWSARQFVCLFFPHHFNCVSDLELKIRLLARMHGLRWLTLIRFSRPGGKTFSVFLLRYSEMGEVCPLGHN